MAWIGWLLAVVAIAGVFCAVWLWNQLKAERAHGSDLLYAKIEAENALDAWRAEQATLPTVSDSRLAIADRLDAPLDTVRAHLQDVGAQLEDYRQRVRQFDLAVQYCLQPVELIFGADKAGLEQLVRHVEEARRRLFEARAALEKSPLHKRADALDGGLGGIRMLADYAQALRQPPEAVASAVQDAPERDPSWANAAD